MVATLAPNLKTACALQLLRVEDIGGRFLGHVFDLRCRWNAGQHEAPVVEAVVIGRAGLLHRLGFRHTRACIVPWTAVQGFRGEHVMVVDAAHMRRDD
jgi:hypothetical protein